MWSFKALHNNTLWQRATVNWDSPRLLLVSKSYDLIPNICFSFAVYTLSAMTSNYNILIQDIRLLTLSYHFSPPPCCMHSLLSLLWTQSLQRQPHFVALVALYSICIAFVAWFVGATVTVILIVFHLVVVVVCIVVAISVWFLNFTFSLWSSIIINTNDARSLCHTMLHAFNAFSTLFESRFFLSCWRNTNFG